jgi:hypothetical protein
VSALPCRRTKLPARGRRRIRRYEDYLEAMADPEHEEHENMMQWRGPFDPETFSVEKTNKQLEKKFHPVRQVLCSGNLFADHSN